MSSWLCTDPMPDVRAMTLTALLALWAANRNSLIGMIAAEEVCRRLVETKREH